MSTVTDTTHTPLSAWSTDLGRSLVLVDIEQWISWPLGKLGRQFLEAITGVTVGCVEQSFWRNEQSHNCSRGLGASWRDPNSAIPFFSLFDICFAWPTWASSHACSSPRLTPRELRHHFYSNFGVQHKRSSSLMLTGWPKRISFLLNLNFYQKRLIIHSLLSNS